MPELRECVRRAEHCLRTGQPNLAVLYMRAGLKQRPIGAAWLAFYDLNEGMRTVWNHMRNIFGPVIELVNTLAEATHSWEDVPEDRPEDEG